MRKSNWKTLVALAFAAAGFTQSLYAVDPEGVVVIQDGHVLDATKGKQFEIRMQTPVKFTADAAAQDPGVHNAGPVRYSSPLEALIVDRNAVTYPPDYGWSRPVKRPVLNRDPVQYHRMDPDYWYGDPRAFVGAQVFPQVYMPTDTTQLGFYYQRVPTWQPNPNMIPAPPWPSTWHAREYPGYQRLHHPDIHRPSLKFFDVDGHGCKRCGGSCNGQCCNAAAAPAAVHVQPTGPAAKEVVPPAPKDTLPPGENLEPVPQKAAPSTQIFFPGTRSSRTATNTMERTRS